MTHLRALLKSPAQLYYGWRIVALSAIVNAVGGGIYQYGFAIFFLPVSKDLHLDRATTSLVFSLSRAEGALEGPVAGWLVDRFGPRYILFFGALGAGAGYLLLSQVNSFAAFLLVYVGVISLCYNGGFTHTILTVINAWFIRHRGLAMSTAISAFSLGGAVLAPLLSLLVAQWGWRTASVLSGLALWALVLPAALGLKRSPESMGLAPDGDPLPSAEQGPTAVLLPEFSVGEAVRTRTYWGLALATTLRLSVINVISIHFVPLMVWKGATEPTGALLLGAMALLSVPARVLLGWVGDQVPKTWVIAAGMLLGVLAFLELLYAQAGWGLWGFVLVFAIVEGVNPLNWALIGDFFGRRRFATLRGIMGLIYTWGTAVAPVFAGAVYDRTGSYTLVLWTLAALYALGSLAFVFVKPPRQPAPSGVTPGPAPDAAPALEGRGGPRA